VQEQQCEQSFLLRTPEAQGLPVPPNLERTQDSELKPLAQEANLPLHDGPGDEAGRCQVNVRRLQAR
jgi:hypothetical protein